LVNCWILYKYTVNALIKPLVPLFFDPHVGCAYIRVCASNKECGSITAFTLCLINLVQILKINKYAYSKDM